MIERVSSLFIAPKRMPRRRPPKAKIIAYKQLKTAAGGGAFSGGGGFYAGHDLVCKAVKDEPGGYAVIIPEYNLPGFVATQALLHTGDEFIAQFLCIHRDRIILSARFFYRLNKKPPSELAVRWQEHFDEVDRKAEACADEESENSPVPDP